VGKDNFLETKEKRDPFTDPVLFLLPTQASGAGGHLRGFRVDRNVDTRPSGAHLFGWAGVTAAATVIWIAIKRDTRTAAKGGTRPAVAARCSQADFISCACNPACSAVVPVNERDTFTTTEDLTEHAPVGVDADCALSGDGAVGVGRVDAGTAAVTAVTRSRIDACSAAADGVCAT
jgi:hypothetical protein